MESVYSQRIRAGKRRTYFFDVRETRGNDYYLTITESRKKFNEDGYDRHKIFLYKEDFNKFLKGMTEAIDYVKTELMPDFDFDAFNHEHSENYEGNTHTENKEPGNTDAATETDSQQASPTAESETPPSTETESPETPEPGDSSSTGSSSNDSEDSKNDTQHEEVDKW
jgi:hypothetical protein